MSKNIIRTAAVAVAGAGLALGLGAGLASADTAPSVAPDGQYLLIRVSVASPLPTGVDVATVRDGTVIVGGKALPGVTAERIDWDGNGRIDGSDPILAMKGDYSIGELRR
ncbi:acetyl-CoA synthetase [Gordonia desulfuricans]|uniref:Acetyl-CoA synthetase n=1 Tax=Gordonia desulfuricans TaxID=89051 RepID=A0A7K3LS74_9ACTN|nr:hypothetical protein [Gordonia desulfuricans]NDK90407.1 acetyl-CoA synthetase [Gordonia desulfuricans]